MYEPAELERLAKKQSESADGAIVAHGVVYALLGLFVGAVYHNLKPTYDPNLVALFFLAVGIALGILVGQGKARSLRLQAQTAFGVLEQDRQLRELADKVPRGTRKG